MTAPAAPVFFQRRSAPQPVLNGQQRLREFPSQSLWLPFWKTIAALRRFPPLKSTFFKAAVKRRKTPKRLKSSSPQTGTTKRNLSPAKHAPLRKKDFAGVKWPLLPETSLHTGTLFRRHSVRPAFRAGTNCRPSSCGVCFGFS